MSNCENCLFGGRKVGPKGPIESEFVIVGEAPLASELATGIPFTGPASKILQDALEAAGYEGSPYYTNALQCLPKDKDVRKLAKATKACACRLTGELNTHKRKIILALGNAALWSVTGDYNLKITRDHGKVFQAKDIDAQVVACYHPAFLLRGGGSLQHFRADIEYAVSLLKGGATKQIKEPNYEILDTPEKVSDLIEKLKIHTGILGADIETTGFDFQTDEVLCIGVSKSPEYVYIIPGDLITPELFNNDCQWTWHNGKFDIKFLRYQKNASARVVHDTMLMSYALNERKGFHDLEQAGSNWLGAPSYKAMLAPYLKASNAHYGHVPKDVLYRYLAIDVSITHLLAEKLLSELKSDLNAFKCYSKVFIEASEYLTTVEMNGIYVDQDWVNKNLEAMSGELLNQETILNEISMDLLGKPINSKSTKQIQHLLYTTLHLGHPNQSTDVDTLQTLKKHPAVEALIKHRKVQKWISTYIKPAIEKRSTITGRIHTTYLIHGTVTGRLSSSGPNMQNIPRDQKIRGQYIPAPGNIFIECDLNQAELRSLACLSKDPNLCAVYAVSGKSIHDEVRDQFFGTPDIWSQDELDKYMTQFNVVDLQRLRDEQKMIAKNVNFGIVYGISPWGLKEQINKPVKDCEAYINAWFARFPKAKEFIDLCKNAVIRGATIATIFGRQKRMGVVTSDRLRNLQNEASNFPHQSIASDITLLTGARIAPILLARWGAFIVNTVHDSILIEAPDKPGYAQQIEGYVCAELAETPRMWGLVEVPFKADAKIGYRWGYLKGQ